MHRLGYVMTEQGDYLIFENIGFGIEERFACVLPPSEISLEWFEHFVIDHVGVPRDRVHREIEQMWPYG